MMASIRAGNHQHFGELICRIRHPFWNSRFNLRADPLPRSTALIGAERATDLLLNVFCPAVTSLTGKIPARFFSERGARPRRGLCDIAERHLGSWAANETFLFPAHRQQGLLQLASDFQSVADPELFAAGIRQACCRWKRGIASDCGSARQFHR